MGTYGLVRLPRRHGARRASRRLAPVLGVARGRRHRLGRAGLPGRARPQAAGRLLVGGPHGLRRCSALADAARRPGCRRRCSPTSPTASSRRCCSSSSAGSRSAGAASTSRRPAPALRETSPRLGFLLVLGLGRQPRAARAGRLLGRVLQRYAAWSARRRPSPRAVRRLRRGRGRRGRARRRLRPAGGPHGLGRGTAPTRRRPPRPRHARRRARRPRGARLLVVVLGVLPGPLLAVTADAAALITGGVARWSPRPRDGRPGRPRAGPAARAGRGARAGRRRRAARPPRLGAAVGVVVLPWRAGTALATGLRDADDPVRTLCLPAPDGACLWTPGRRREPSRPASSWRPRRRSRCSTTARAGPRDTPVTTALLLAAATGGAGVAASRDIGTWLVTLELATVPVIALVALRGTRTAAHGALTLLVTSLTSFALLVLGAALWLTAPATPRSPPTRWPRRWADPQQRAVLVLAVVLAARRAGLQALPRAVPRVDAAGLLHRRPRHRRRPRRRLEDLRGSPPCSSSPRPSSVPPSTPGGGRRPGRLPRLLCCWATSWRCGRRLDPPARVVDGGAGRLGRAAGRGADRRRACGRPPPTCSSTRWPRSSPSPRSRRWAPEPSSAPAACCAATGWPVGRWPSPSSCSPGCRRASSGWWPRSWRCGPAVDAGLWPLALTAVVAVVLGIAVYLRWFALLLGRPRPGTQADRRPAVDGRRPHGGATRRARARHRHPRCCSACCRGCSWACCRDGTNHPPTVVGQHAQAPQRAEDRCPLRGHVGPPPPHRLGRRLRPATACSSSSSRSSAWRRRSTGTGTPTSSRSARCTPAR